MNNSAFRGKLEYRDVQLKNGEMGVALRNGNKLHLTLSVMVFCELRINAV